MAATLLEVGGGGGERFIITKSHSRYDKAAAAHGRLVAQQRQLLDLLLPCLVMVPAGWHGRWDTADGRVGESAAPQAKVMRTSRRSCTVQ